MHLMRRIELDTGAVIELTPSHLVLKPDGQYQTAGLLRPGDSMMLQQGTSTAAAKVVPPTAEPCSDGVVQVQLIEEVRGPVRAPITMSGTIVVNGVVASCYAFGGSSLMLGHVRNCCVLKGGMSWSTRCWLLSACCIWSLPHW